MHPGRARLSPDSKALLSRVKGEQAAKDDWKSHFPKNHWTPGQEALPEELERTQRPHQVRCPRGATQGRQCPDTGGGASLFRRQSLGCPTSPGGEVGRRTYKQTEAKATEIWMTQSTGPVPTPGDEALQDTAEHSSLPLSPSMDTVSPLLSFPPSIPPILPTTYP